MPEKKPSFNTNNILFHWVDNLVGTPTRFAFNLVLTIFGGIMYSFGIWPSPFVLAIFGVLSPLLFTLCLYYLMRQLSQTDDNPFPRIFTSQSTNGVVMFFDMVIIITLAILIHIGVINYLFFRLLQTAILPLLLIFMLRYIYLTITTDENDMGDTDDYY